jgi:hypothetical protein
MKQRYDYEVDYIIVLNPSHHIHIITAFINLTFGMHTYVIDDKNVCLNLKDHIINGVPHLFDSRMMTYMGDKTTVIRKTDECEMSSIEDKMNVLCSLAINVVVQTLKPFGITDHGWYKIRIPHISL